MGWMSVSRDFRSRIRVTLKLFSALSVISPGQSPSIKVSLETFPPGWRAGPAIGAWAAGGPRTLLPTGSRPG